MELFRSELKRAFQSKWFIIVVLIQICIAMVHVIMYVFPAVKGIPILIDYYESNPLAVDGIPGVFSTWIGMNTNAAKEIFFVTLPIVSAIPYGASLYIDEKNRYVNNIVTRTTKKNFYISKMSVMFLSGGTIAIIPLILSLLINMCMLPIEQPQASTAMYLMGNKNIFGDIFYKNPFLYTFIYIIWVFLLVGLLTSFCFTATYIMENRFIIILAPFILYFVTYVMGSMFGSGMAYMWQYIQLNKIERTQILHIICQVILLIIINSIALFIKCSKRNDVL